MSAPLTPRGAPATEREIVLAKRAACLVAVRALFDLGVRLPSNWEGSIALGEKLFPLPKITRPREVFDPVYTHTKWRCMDGELEFRDSESRDWLGTNPAPTAMRVTAARVRMWYDLLTNPTEEIEDDGSVSLLPGEERT